MNQPNEAHILQMLELTRRTNDLVAGQSAKVIELTEAMAGMKVSVEYLRADLQATKTNSRDDDNQIRTEFRADVASIRIYQEKLKSRIDEQGWVPRLLSGTPATLIAIAALLWSIFGK